MKTTIEQIQSLVHPVLKKYMITRAHIFGSYARNEQTNASDLDILIDAPRSVSLLDIVGLQQDLEDALGIKVDVVTERSLYPEMRTSIFKHIVSLV